MTIKLVSLFCLLHMLNLYGLEVCHREGLLLCRLQNQPHRGLGTLFYAAMKAPHRADFFLTYIVQYNKMVDDEWIIEGQTRPVVSMYAVSTARSFPKNKEVQMMRRIIMHNNEVRLQMPTAEQTQ